MTLLPVGDPKRLQIEKLVNQAEDELENIRTELRYSNDNAGLAADNALGMIEEVAGLIPAS